MTTAWVAWANSLLSNQIRSDSPKLLMTADELVVPAVAEVSSNVSTLPVAPSNPTTPLVKSPPRLSSTFAPFIT